ncbi:MAG: hypothetical protein GX540_04270 [Clostridiales bacterium]|nr:hypothetical protein [Clostridiales bacterium]
MVIKLNGLAHTNETSATWLKGKNYVTVDTAFGSTKHTYTATITKTGQTITALTVTAADGTEPGDTKLSVAGTRLAGTSLVYKIADASITTPTLDDVLTGYTPWNGTDDITAAHGKYIGVAEILSNGMVKSFGQAQADSDGE